MRYFIVYAHPEPASFNGSLKDYAVEHLTAQGHEVRVSDLYRMRFKAVADADDFPARDRAQRLVYHQASSEAYAAGQQREDIRAEQEKLIWADIVVLQFPLWWFSVPAILKGWIDRVFVHGLAIGVPKAGTRQWLRYGEGRLAGRRALLAVTTGGREEQFSERGINGPIDDLLFPLNHGLFHYTGMSPLKPFIAFRTVRASAEQFTETAKAYLERLLRAEAAEPIAYRTENGGDYDARGVLVEVPDCDRRGFSRHERRTERRPVSWPAGLANCRGSS
jgi:NAD(P)H dehydrogenase (quinone)